MKTLRQIEDRILTVIMVVALMVPLVLVALSEDNTPTLSFEGARINAMPDGSVQLLFDVCISHVERTTGAAFSLCFNSQYIVPSRQTDNTKLEEDDFPMLAFSVNPELYQVYHEDEGDRIISPFMDPDPDDVGIVDFGDMGYLTMILYTNNGIEPGENSLMQRVAVGEGTDERSENIFEARNKLVLGTLSFRVVDPGLLPEITRKFDGLQNVLFDDNHARDDEWDQLIFFDDIAKKEGEDPWGIGVVIPGNSGRGLQSATWNDYVDPKTNTNKAQATFTYNFPKTLISATVAEAEVTVDAYQAYTNGTVSDLDIVLQKYSPMVLLRYSNGDQENVIVPWGRVAADGVDDLPWTASVAKLKAVDTDEEADKDKYFTVKNGDDVKAADEVAYDPTASGYKSYDWYEDSEAHYVVTKDFWYREGGAADGEIKAFPIPVQVKLTVIPITLVDVTAENLERVYSLEGTQTTRATNVQSVSDLELPDEARLVTDIPAGGATLTMPIWGWTHVNKEKTEDTQAIYWPYLNTTVDPSAVRMEDLWKDGAEDGTYLHWPTTEDASNDNGWQTKEGEDNSLRGRNRAGTYTFSMSDSYGGEPVLGFTRAEIQAAYPGLTVPACTKWSVEEPGEEEPGDETDDETDETLDLKEIWPIGDVIRKIVWNNDPDPDPENKDKIPVPKEQYQVEYIETKTLTESKDKFLPQLTLRVTKWAVDETNVQQDMAEGSVFRIRMPDGTEIGIGDKAGDASLNLPDWFNGNDGSYKATASTTNGLRSFDLVTEPGDTSTGNYMAERERLLRHINLGGWFYVSVNEDVAKNYWTDFIPVYVPPRENVHLESKVYNFIGENADLYHFVNAGTKENPVFPTTITLPVGSYGIVDEDGEPVYVDGEEEDEYGDPIQVQVTERYGVKTLYSGITGAQPGELNTFSIEAAKWKEDTGEIYIGDDEIPITIYGANEFKHKALYGAYNWVYNIKEVPFSNGTDYYTATIRVQRDLEEPERPDDEDPDPEKMREKIKLVYFGLPGGVTPYYDSSVDILDRENVSLVTFDTKVEGYTVRQEYTLTIVNVGDVDIYGLSIDLLTDSPKPAYQADQGGGNFMLLKPPASYLPVGGSTTFTLSYQFDLSGGTNPTDKFLEYLDKLYITSDSKHKVTAGPGETLTPGVDYLLDFDAQFRVTRNDIHHVWVRYYPADGSMGTAQVVVGSTETTGPVNGNAGSNTAEASDPPDNYVYVFVMATPTDEYEVGSYGAVGSDGTTVPLVPYIGTVYLPDGSEIQVDETTQIRVWYLEMPDQDVTVTVRFYEPIRSKLRLSNLRVFAAENKCEHDTFEGDGHEGELRDYVTPTDPELEYTVWQKEFDQKDLDAAADWDSYPAGYSQSTDMPTEEEQGRYLMTLQSGKVVKAGFDSSVNQYLVVIPYEAELAQVEVKLRELVYEFNGLDPDNTNEDLDKITVVMTWFPEEVGPYRDLEKYPAQKDRFDSVYDNSNQYQIYYSDEGTTRKPTEHTSKVFDAPSPGASSYVRVSLSYSDNSGEGGTTVTETRYYFVEIHRPTKTPIATLKYGNSPYGMIMNDGSILDKEAAKKAFVDNNYSFSGLDDLTRTYLDSLDLAHLTEEEKETLRQKARIPYVVRDTQLETLHYWTEAWVAVDAPYEPESGLGFIYTYDPATNTDIGVGTLKPNPDIYNEENNLDLNDYTLFGILGEKVYEPGLINVLDSTGRPAQVDKAVLYVEAYGLDTEADTQTQRFALPFDPASPDLTEEQKAALAEREVVLYRHHPAGGIVEDWYMTHSAEEGEEEEYLYLRPGRYKLIYIIPDYNYIPDYTTGTIPDDWTPEEGKVLRVERDFVVLAPVGDVNADLETTDLNGKTTVKTQTDYELVQKRITDPLGYMADNYPDGAIFKFRTVDVNNDRNINNIDANTIREGKGVERFYLTTDYIYPRPENAD